MTNGFFFGANKEKDYFFLAFGRRVITLSYFSFSLAAFFSYGCLSSAVLLFHISPSFLAVSPIVSPGLSLFTLGRNSAQKRKNADLQEQHVRYFMLGCTCCVAKTHFRVSISDIRRSLRGIGVLESLLLVAFRGHVILHFPLIAHLVLFCHVFKFAFLFWRHRLVARGEIQGTRVTQYNW